MDRQSQFMKRALELGRKGEGRTRPNPPVGAVIENDGVVVGEGFHPRAGEPHAEIFALRQAGEKARGGVLYVTLEPCNHAGRTGPCCDALIAAGIKKAVIGTRDPNPEVAGGGGERLMEAGIEVVFGVEETSCLELIAPYSKHIQTGIPYLILKAALTLDGQLATCLGDSRWVTGAESRERVHRFRDRVDAVLVGIGTVLADDPRLNTRLPEGKDPIRVVLDRQLKIPEDARMLRENSPAPTWIITGSRVRGDKSDRLAREGVEIFPVAEAAGGLDLFEVMRFLGGKGIQSVLAEGGSRLNASFFNSDLVDRMLLFFSPKFLGGNDGMPLFAGKGAEWMADARLLTNTRVSRVGDDFLIDGDLRNVHRPG